MFKLVATVNTLLAELATDFGTLVKVSVVVLIIDFVVPAVGFVASTNDLLY